MSSSNPKNWRFTWEAQSHTPTLRLFLFNACTNPSLHCNSTLSVQLISSQSHLLVTWLEQRNGDALTQVSLKVPMPNVLIDPDSQLFFRALDDHIEVKLPLLIPVDHPIISSFNSASGVVKPLVVDSDIKALSSREEVDFYCRRCSVRLTIRPLRNFVEMPSVNWQEAADNWFGGCCCSFGGISEKLVNRFASAYGCAKGLCLLSSTAVTLCKDDLLGCEFPEFDSGKKNDFKLSFDCDNAVTEESFPAPGMNDGSVAQCERVQGVDMKLRCLNLDSENLDGKVNCVVTEEETNGDKLFGEVSISIDLENEPSSHRCCDSTSCSQDDIDENSIPDVTRPFLENQKTKSAAELLENQRSFLNGFLGNAFMARSYNLSTNIEWKEYFCPECSSLLGVYPCTTDDMPIDAGVRLFKCYISTSLSVGGSDDLFRSYTAEKMFANLLVESAKDELSFRTLVRDLTTKSPMLQVVLLNPNLWCCSGTLLNLNQGC